MRRGLEIVAQDLHKAYEGGLVFALRGVDLKVERGERVAVIGPTGCGKSTLLALLALLDRPDRGEILIDDLPASSLHHPEEWRNREVGIVFQFHYLLPHLTVEENVALPVLDGRDKGFARARELVDRLGLGSRARTLASVLSGGERQLAALARALVNDPAFVLADEPTGSVDSATGGRILDELLGWADRCGGTLVVVTHDPSVAGRMDRTMQMRDGRVVDGGKPAS